MSLATELVQAGTPPGRLEVNCRIVMDEVPGQGHQIVGSVLRVRADVDGADDARSRGDRARRRGLSLLGAAQAGGRGRAHLALSSARSSSPCSSSSGGRSRARRRPREPRRERDRPHAVASRRRRRGRATRRARTPRRAPGPARPGRPPRSARSRHSARGRAASARLEPPRAVRRGCHPRPFVANAGRRRAPAMPIASARRANCASFPAQIISSPSRAR